MAASPALPVPAAYAHPLGTAGAKGADRQDDGVVHAFAAGQQSRRQYAIGSCRDEEFAANRYGHVCVPRANVTIAHCDVVGKSRGIR